MDPREHARGIHGASLTGGRKAAHVFANDNRAARRLCLSITGDSTIFQIDATEENEAGSMEVRVPIDFLRGRREARNGDTWPDERGSVILPMGRSATIALACRRGETGMVVKSDDLAYWNLELALSQALTENDREECRPLTGSLVDLEHRQVRHRHAA